MYTISAYFVSLWVKHFASVWYINLNTCFQFLDHIIRIFTNFFIHMYFQKNKKLLFKHTYQTSPKTCTTITDFFFLRGIVQKGKGICFTLNQCHAGLFLQKKKKKSCGTSKLEMKAKIPSRNILWCKNSIFYVLSITSSPVQKLIALISAPVQQDQK